MQFAHFNIEDLDRDRDRDRQRVREKERKKEKKSWKGERKRAIKRRGVIWREKALKWREMQWQTIRF